VPDAAPDAELRDLIPRVLATLVRRGADFATRLEQTGEFGDAQALVPRGMWVSYDGAGRQPLTDGPFAETKDLIAGWMVIDVDSEERAIELAAELSSAPGAGGAPIHEWLELRPFMTAAPNVSD
jgi:hypothetical protein